MSFFDPLPSLRSRQWQLVVLVMLDVLSIHQLPALAPVVSNSKLVQKVTNWFQFSLTSFCASRTYLLLLSTQLICFLDDVLCRCWMPLRLAERSTSRWLISSSLLEDPFRHSCRYSLNEKPCKSALWKLREPAAALHRIRYMVMPEQTRVNTGCYLRVVVSYWTNCNRAISEKPKCLRPWRLLVPCDIPCATA